MPYAVRFVQTYTSAKMDPCTESQAREAYSHKRVAVVDVPHSDAPVVIPLKHCMRDPEMDTGAKETLFLLPIYTPWNVSSFPFSPVPSEPHMLQYYNNGGKLTIKVSRAGNRVTIGYAAHDGSPELTVVTGGGAGVSLAISMRVPGICSFSQSYSNATQMRLFIEPI